MARQDLHTLPAHEVLDPDNSAASTTAVGGRELAADLFPHWRPDFLTHGLDYQSFLNRVVELAQILTKSSGAAIAFRGEQGTICRARSGEGAPPLGAPVDTNSGISKQCLDSGTPLFCEDIAKLGRVDPKISQAAGIRGVAVLPIYRDGEISGILEVFSSTPRIFTDQQLKRLQQLAHWVGSAENTPRNIPGEEPTWNRNVVFRLTILVRPPIPWKRFLESAFFHVILVGMLLGASKIQPREVLVSPEPPRDAHVTYYPFSQSYPARESSRGAAPRRQTSAHASARGSAPRSARGSAPRGITAGDEFKPETPSGTTTSRAANSAEGQKPPALTTPLPAMPNVASSRFGKPGLGVANPIMPPPDVGKGESRRFNLPNSSAIAPSPDLSVASESRRVTAPGAVVIPPSPDVQGSMSRSMSRSGVTRAGELGRGSAATSDVAIVAPPPSISDHQVLTYRATGGITNNAADVVAPPPSIQARAGRGIKGSILTNGGGSEVVPPPPSIERGKSVGVGRANLLADSGSQVVPPAPSIQSSGKYGEGGRTSPLAGRGASQIVPPTPSLDGGKSLAARRGNLLFGTNSSVVPPAPSIRAEGAPGNVGRISPLAGRGTSQIVPPTPSLDGGKSFRAGRGSLLAGSDSQVVPPAPSIQGGGKYAEGGRTRSLAPAGSQVVPPPPSVQDGAGGATGGGRLNSLANGGSQVVPPPPSAEGRGLGSVGRATPMADSGAEGPLPPGPTNGAGNSQSGGSGIAQDVSNSSVPEDDNEGAHPGFQDVQLRVISLAWAPPRSSFFSSFEVFIAEKWLRKDKSQLIKLVYVFLPYQQRLSEYTSGDLNVRKLRVTRDPTCDESLIQMTWPEGENGKGAQKPGDAQATSSNRNDLLPCYRTTADDYRRAVSHNR
jgi:hypothetical protein